MKKKMKEISRWASPLFPDLQETNNTFSTSDWQPLWKTSPNYYSFLYICIKKVGGKLLVLGCPWLQPNFSKYFSTSQNTVLTSSSHKKCCMGSSGKRRGRVLHAFLPLESSRVWGRQKTICKLLTSRSAAISFHPMPSKQLLLEGDTSQREGYPGIWQEQWCHKAQKCTKLLLCHPSDSVKGNRQGEPAKP